MLGLNTSSDFSTRCCVHEKHTAASSPQSAAEWLDFCFMVSVAGYVRWGPRGCGYEEEASANVREMETR